MTLALVSFLSFPLTLSALGRLFSTALETEFVPPITYAFITFSSLINLSNASTPSLGLDKIIGILFWAAGAPTLTASLNPFSPFTTATSLISFISLSLLAKISEVSYLSLPLILSTLSPLPFNLFSISLLSTAFSVLSSSLSLSVKSIGAPLAFANGVAESASANELSLTSTTLGLELYAFWLIFTAVSYLPLPINFSSVSAYDGIIEMLLKVSAIVSIVKIVFGAFIIIPPYFV